MTATTSPATESPAVEDSPDPTVGFRRVGGAIALPLAFVFQLACNAIYAVVSTESGLSDTEDAAQTLEFYGRYPSAFLAMTVLAMVGVLVMVPGLLAGLRVLRPVRPRLALWAVALMVTGYICYFGIVTTNFGTLGLAEQARLHPAAELTAAVDAGQSPVLIPFFLLFVAGNLVGTLLLGLAVILGAPGARVPRVAGVLILGWPIGHALNVFAGLGEWFAVAGGALEIAGLSLLALSALRTSNSEWAARG